MRSQQVVPGISIIIVNYNVKYFLRQCLQSILKTSFNGDLEVIVVDNQSTDGSDRMMSEEFPQISYVYNDHNVGFSKANNQGIAMAAHPYTLILNPDTILQEDTLTHCHDFMAVHPRAGAVGVKMVDGSGTYLPESKRGFPTPLTALFKLTGLSRLFPRSSLFNRYYLGHLDPNQAHKVEVLTGAFLFGRTALLREIGGFDEDYFMYGEDIELSFQIRERDWEVHYLPTTSIVHFKGESTKKLSGPYLKRFYGAMGIYAGKRQRGSGFWTLLLYLGIGLSAISGGVQKLAKTILRPLSDLLLLYWTAKGIQWLWASYYHKDEDYFLQATYFGPIFLGLIVMGLFIYHLLGQYDESHNKKHLILGFLFSSLFMLAAYSLLPLEMRTSRPILVLLVLAMPWLLYFSRVVHNKLLHGRFSFDKLSSKRVGVVGESHSVEKIKRIVREYSGEKAYQGRIGVTAPGPLGGISDLEAIVNSRSLNELIFCSSDLTTQKIFSVMSILGSGISYKVANNDNSSILGSDSKEKVGEWYTLDIFYKISQPFHRRSKRILDIGYSIFYVVLLPVVFLMSPARTIIYSNLVPVLSGRKTWVGYAFPDDRLEALPELRKGVFSAHPPKEDNHGPNLYYAKNYSTWNELVHMLSLTFSLNHTHK